MRRATTRGANPDVVRGDRPVERPLVGVVAVVDEQQLEAVTVDTLELRREALEHAADLILSQRRDDERHEAHGGCLPCFVLVADSRTAYRARVTERPTTPWWMRALGLAALALVLSTFAWSEMLAAYPRTQNGDGQFFHQMLEAMRVSILDYHELPLWNPYQCGGVPLWDNPQGVAAAPVLWALLPFGTTFGIQLWYIVHSAIGFACMWLLARHELRLSRGAALVASAAFAFSGVHNQHLTGGHLVWAPYLYFPLAILFWRRAEHDLRHAVGLGVVVAWSMHEGGTYPLPHLALLLFLETLTRLWPVKRLLPIARAAAVVAVVGLGLGASRFLPVLDQLHWHTRHVGVEHDRMTWQTLKDVFLARNHGRDVPGQEYAWTEYGDYLGPIILALAVVGIFLGGLENAWLLVLLVISLALMLGHQGRWAPATILKVYVYPFKQMRVPSRFDACATVFLAAYAGIAVDRLSALASRLLGRWRVRDAVRMATLAIALVGAGDIVGAGISFGAQFFTSVPQALDVAPVSSALPGRHQPRAVHRRATAAPRPSRLLGRVGIRGERPPLQGGDVPQARAADSTAHGALGDPDAEHLHPRRARVRSRARTSSLNDAYDRGWRSSVGEAVRAGKAWLAIDLPAGDHAVVVRYWPHGLTAGFVLAGLTLVGVVLFFIWDARRRARRAVSVSAASRA